MSGPISESTPTGGGAASPAETDESVALVELVNRVLDRGVCLTGDVVVSVAGVELLYLELNLLLSSIETIEQHRANGDGP